MTTHKALRWAFVCLAVVVAGFFVLNAANTVLSYIPGTSQWSGRRAVAKVERLEGQVSSLERTATGNAEIDRAKDTYHTREIIYRDIQSQADHEARAAPDASDPLPPERLARHLRNDERVCLNASFTCTPLDAPSSGPGAVPPDDVAG